MNDVRQKKAIEHHSRWWPGWIWAVPVAALIIVAWLGFKTFASRGPEVTVTFDRAPGVKADDTKVQYHGMEVGQVVAVNLKKGLHKVDVVLRFHSVMDGEIGPGTRFWIAGQKVTFSNPQSLRALIAGPYIGVDPHPGKTQQRFAGLNQEPLSPELQSGSEYTLHADTLGSISRGTPLYYRDLQVGNVHSTTLSANGQGFDIDAFVRAPYNRLVHVGTRFWKAGAVQISTNGGGPRIRLQSIPALINGAIAFETPTGPAEGVAAHAGKRFTLYESEDRARDAPPPGSVAYAIDFSEPVSGLDVGAPVRLMGTQIGAVSNTKLAYDPATGRLSTDVVVLLNTANIELPEGQAWGTDPRKAMDAMLSKLIGKGLRAELGSSVPVVGGKEIQLNFVPKATVASLGSGSPPLIPTGPETGINGIMTSASQAIAKLNGIPFQQIGDNVHQATERLAALSKSPELTDSLHRLDASVANIEKITGSLRSETPPVLAALRHAAAEAQRTLASAQTLMGRGNGWNGPQTTALPHALYELSQAAKSLRTLSDYLDRHPEALIRGRNG